MMKDEGKVLEEILGSVNNENIKLRPHCSIGALVAQPDSEIFGRFEYGTAFLISPNLVLTAAYNCFNIE